MSTEQGTIVIKSIISAIAQKDNEAVYANLDRLPLGIISRDKAETLISWFLNQAFKSLNIEAARIVISIFDIKRMQVNPIPALTYLALNPLLSSEVLTFAISCFPEKLPIAYFEDLVNMGDDQGALRAAGILTTVLPSISYEDWGTLYRLTNNVEEEEYENQLLRAFFQIKVAETGNSAKRPKWVQSNIPKSIIQTVPDGIPSVKEAVDLLLGDFQRLNINLVSAGDNTDENDPLDSEIQDTIISQYAISLITEKIQMLAPVKQIPNFDDIPLFQEFGPVNTIYTLNPNIIDPSDDCGKYGGCRMLLCTEFEEMHTDGEKIDIMAIDDQPFFQDWFRGSCDKCLKKISKRHYAIRQPLCHGGWKGCYCSFECMEENIENANIALMIGRMKEQLVTIGIRDH